MISTIEGQTYELKPDGVEFRWFHSDGERTEVFGATEQEARRNWMFRGLSIARAKAATLIKNKR